MIRLALLGVLSVFLSACDTITTTSTTTPSVTVKVVDNRYGVTFEYQTTADFLPLVTPLTDYQPDATELSLITAINAERVKGGICPNATGGKVTFPPTLPFKFEAHLYKSAKIYATEMAQKGIMGHKSTVDNSLPSQRMVAAGFKPVIPTNSTMVLEENLAFNVPATEIIAAWKGSTTHCTALFEPLAKTAHAGIAQATGNTGIYWALNLAGW